MAEAHSLARLPMRAAHCGCQHLFCSAQNCNTVHCSLQSLQHVCITLSMNTSTVNEQTHWQINNLEPFNTFSAEKTSLNVKLNYYTMKESLMDCQLADWQSMSLSYCVFYRCWKGGLSEKFTLKLPSKISVKELFTTFTFYKTETNCYFFNM